MDMKLDQLHSQMPCEFKVAKTIWKGRKMGNEGNNAPGKGIIDRLSLAECELCPT